LAVIAEPLFFLVSFSGTHGSHVALARTEASSRTIEEFSPGSQRKKGIAGWDEKSFVGHTQYSIVEDGGEYVLRAFADGTASGLVRKVKFDAKELPWLSWRWKVTKLPEKGDVHYKETDDYAARIYVVFPHFLRWRTRTISYIWAAKLPVGESIPNPWLPRNVIMIAVQSGTDGLGVWIREKRNLQEDYVRLFGEEPPRAGAIGIMSDGDNTRAQAEAYYDDLVLTER